MCSKLNDIIFVKEWFDILGKYPVGLVFFSYDKSAVYHLEDMSSLPYYVLSFLFSKTPCLTLV